MERRKKGDTQSEGEDNIEIDSSSVQCRADHTVVERHRKDLLATMVCEDLIIAF